MPDWLSDLFTSDAFAVFLGALLGALFGYGTSRFLAWQETRAKRKELFSLVFHQFSMLDRTLEPFDPAIGRHLDPVDLHAIGLLLDGKTLSYRTDSYLIRVLDMLRQQADKYNAYARLANMGDLLTELDIEQRQRLYHFAQEKYSTVILGIDSVTEVLSVYNRDRQRKWWRRVVNALSPASKVRGNG